MGGGSKSSKVFILPNPNPVSDCREGGGAKFDKQYIVFLLYIINNKMYFNSLILTEKGKNIRSKVFRIIEKGGG